MDTKKEIEWLVKELEEADFLYYNFGSSDYSDEEYDQMEERLLKLDPKNKRFKDGKRNVVGAKVPEKKKDKKSWEKVKHKYKMGSQRKVTTLEDLKKWQNDLVGEYHRLIVEDKLDGISLQLNYKNGKLVSSVTRGDGCLDYNSKIEFDDGSIHSIGYVIENNIHGKIKCYNHEEDCIEFCEITSFFINENDSEWYEIEVEDIYGILHTLKITGNHHIWCPNLNCYRQIEDISNNDYIALDI